MCRLRAGALWSHDSFNQLRVAKPKHDEPGRIVVAVDPSGGSEDGHDEQVRNEPRVHVVTIRPEVPPALQ